MTECTARALTGGLLGTVFLAALIPLTARAQETVLPGAIPDHFVVTATPLPKAPDALAQPVVIIDREALRNADATSLGELLGNKPGITQSSFARGASRPIIRGLDNTRVRMQENGLGNQGASAFSEDHGIPVDVLSAQRVEVIRGPATLRYGSEAIGGVVNVLNHRIPARMPEKTATGEAHGSVSSVDSGEEYALRLRTGAENIALHMDTFGRSTEDYKTPGGIQQFTWSRASGFSAGTSAIMDWGYMGVSVSHFDSDYGLPAPDSPANPVTIDLEQKRYAFETKARNPLGWGETLHLSASYTDYTHDEVTGGVVGSRYDNEETEIRAELLHPRVAGFEGALGVQWYQRDLSATGEGGELIAPGDTKRMAVFLFEETPLSRTLTLQLGGRIEHVELQGSAFNRTSGKTVKTTRDFTPLSGSTALIQSLGEGLNLGISFQAVQRSPDSLELFAKGPHEATKTFELGTATLGLETAFSTEISLKKTKGPLTFEAGVFYTQFDNFIFKKRTGLTCGEEYASCAREEEEDDGHDDDGEAGHHHEELTQIIYSRDDATFRGAEIGVNWEAFSWNNGVAGFDARFDIVRAELDKHGNAPRIPPYRIGGGAYFRSDNFHARVGVLRVAEQNRLATFETKTSGYTRLDAQARYALTLPGTATKFIMGLTATNLLDKKIRNHVSFKKEGVSLPGRNVRFSTTIRF